MKLAMLALAVATTPAASAVPPIETFVEAPGPSGPLKGTMLAPAGGGPVVLIIPGSGPTDRNGNSPAGISAAPYKLLAEGLAERGLTTVRIDKRGMFASAAATADANAVTIADYVEDIRSWAAVLRKEAGAPCIWLLGHSEGGLVALAARENPDICGLVLVSAAGLPIGVVLREQLKASPAFAPMLDRAFAAIERLEAGERVDTTGMPPQLTPLFYPGVQGFLISLLSYDPAKLIADYDGPVMIVQGGRDIQTSEQDARLLKSANGNARLVMVPDANHVLKSVATDDRAANVATYSDPSLPLAPGVVEAIADFVATR